MFRTSLPYPNNITVTCAHCDKNLIGKDVLNHLEQLHNYDLINPTLQDSLTLRRAYCWEMNLHHIFKEYFPNEYATIDDAVMDYLP